MLTLPGLILRGAPSPDVETVLTPGAVEFLAKLERRFRKQRRQLLAARGDRACALAGGALPGFLKETADIRSGDWRVAQAPRDLLDRRVEITGPVDRKMMINALNSGAKVFMADFEDALSPTWENVIGGQRNLMDAVRRTISLETAGKRYALQERTATLVVRPRGWHLDEKHLLLDGEPVSASLFDFGLYLFHNAKELSARGTGPYFYLPKLENHLEARLWSEVFVTAEEALSLPRGTIRATVLIETILAAFEMDEILYELRDHVCGLNAGRWDYIFSIIKKLGTRPGLVFPDRKEITMTVPFMRAYTELLVRTCHARGAHAMGGMAAFVPSRKDPVMNARAFQQVRDDKDREATDGFDGTWVAHPDLVPVAIAEFDRVLDGAENQLSRLRSQVEVTPEMLLDFRIPGARITQAGLANDVSVALQYLAHWLDGTGAVTIFNLMEDAATAEIARSQLWQWIHQGARLEVGRTVTPEVYLDIRAEVAAELEDLPHLEEAKQLLDRLVLAEQFPEFLTPVAYALLD